MKPKAKILNVTHGLFNKKVGVLRAKTYDDHLNYCPIELDRV